MSKVQFKFVDSLLGRALVAEDAGGRLCYLSLPKGKPDAVFLDGLRKLYPDAEETTTLQCEVEVVRVLDGEPAAKSLNVHLDGPEFSVRVWESLMKIPYGSVASYADIARDIGRPTAYRAVARACNRNHIAIVVPCHRIVASNGDISGFGWGVENKIMLLNREGYTKYR